MFGSNNNRCLPDDDTSTCRNEQSNTLLRHISTQWRMVVCQRLRIGPKCHFCYCDRQLLLLYVQEQHDSATSGTGMCQCRRVSNRHQEQRRKRPASKSSLHRNATRNCRPVKVKGKLITLLAEVSHLDFLGPVLLLGNYGMASATAYLKIN